MSDRIAVMNDGQIEHLAGPREIYEHPATKFVAGFIGTSNLLSGTVTSIDAGRATLVLGPGERIIVPINGSKVATGATLELSVRPEKIDMSMSEPAAGDRSVVRGKVTEIVYLGTSTNYNVTTSTGAEIVVFDQNASSAEDIAARGDTVFLSWNPQHSYPIGS
jgi:spermidine/putrescine transport system ATP-binding protein